MEDDEYNVRRIHVGLFSAERPLISEAWRCFFFLHFVEGSRWCPVEDVGDLQVTVCQHSENGNEQTEWLK